MGTLREDLCDFMICRCKGMYCCVSMATIITQTLHNMFSSGK